MSISLLPEVPSSEVYGTVMLREHVYRSQDRIFELEIENTRRRTDGQQETVQFQRTVKNALGFVAGKLTVGIGEIKLRRLNPPSVPGPASADGFRPLPVSRGLALAAQAQIRGRGADGQAAELGRDRR